ncbi:hypothetical protein [Jannaschia sp. CCS1]|uniref:hypothetical protein n=1 Tax=Jannaschia sp. (strain CCS1) TaxID=290400 RepID=UPI000053DD19|nr:hypothetical protein [Jannaschia sp. CCS1]ABD55204.1 hypothetical protein Jann_2287 [Jannaschia sp. CCS1]
MKTDPHVQSDAPPHSAGLAARPAVLAVALSDAALSQMPRHVLAPEAAVSKRPLAHISVTETTGPDAPDLILAPLTARGFDAMDLLTTLSQARFAGRVLILAPHMPDIPLVRADVLAEAPDLNVDLIALDGSSALHLV